MLDTAAYADIRRVKTADNEMLRKKLNEKRNTKMKKTVITILALALAGILLAGCSVSSFSTSSINNKVTIEMNGVKDGDVSETGPITVEDGQSISVDVKITKGTIKIDFLDAATAVRKNDSDSVSTGKVISSLTMPMSGTNSYAVTIGKGEYLLQVSAVGETSGTATVNVK